MTATPEKAEKRTGDDVTPEAFCYWETGRIGLALTVECASVYMLLTLDQASDFAYSLAAAISQYKHLERGLADACGEKP